MKAYIILIFSAVGLAFYAGNLALKMRSSQNISVKQLDQIERLKHTFVIKTTPADYINFTSIYLTPSQLKLLNPLYFYPKEDFESLNVRSFYGNRDCFKHLPQYSYFVEYEKMYIWEEFRCGKRAFLPRDFFLTPPFLHPIGKSYVYLALQSKNRSFENKTWVQSHLSFFHVKELPELKEKYGPFPPTFEFLSNLNTENLQDIIERDDFIFTDQFILKRSGVPFFSNIVGMEYRMFTFKQLNTFLAKSAYQITNNLKSATCLYREGRICWRYSEQHIFSVTNKASYILLIIIVLAISSMIVVVIIKFRDQRLEDQQKRLALRVLSHEFRTPVTTLLLLIDKLSKNYDKYDGETVEGILKISGEVHRLQRLVEKSRSYLTLDNSKNSHINMRKIESLNECLEENVYLNQTTEENVKYIENPDDTEITTDPYWLSICLKNLIENALRHGQAPIIVSFQNDNKSVRISVKDQGSCEFKSIKEMTREFIKGSSSEGTGLGLNIVQKIVGDLGGRIEFNNSPTEFIIVLNK